MAGQTIALADNFAGGEGPFTYSVQAGVLPSGMSLDSNTGVISGTPDTVETQAGIVIRITDNNTATADSNSFTLDVVAP